MFTLYKIYYGDTLAYLGRTRQPLKKRLHGHFFKKRLHKAIDIFLVTRIESAQFQTCADMYLYEIYYINTLHPMLNRDDAAPDELTVALPEVPFVAFECDLMEKWKAELHIKKSSFGSSVSKGAKVRRRPRAQSPNSVDHLGERSGTVPPNISQQRYPVTPSWTQLTAPPHR